MAVKIRKAVLTNCFQHRDLEVNLSDFHVLVGQNGSGKSNVLEAILYAIGCKFGLDGQKASMITEGESSGRVGLQLEHDGRMVDIRAQLGKSTRTLKVGDLKLSKSADVLEYMQDAILGTTFNVVTQAAAIRQKDLETGLFDTWARMMSSFSRLAGLDDIEAKRTRLAREVDRIVIPTFSLDIESTEATIKSSREGITVLKNEVTELEKRTDDSKLSACRHTLFLRDSAAEAAQALREAAEAESGLKDTHTKQKQALEAETAELKKLLADEDSFEQLADEARNAIAAYDSAKQTWDRHVRLKQEVASVTAELEAVKDPPPLAPSLNGTIDELREVVSQAEAQRSVLKKSLAGLHGAEGSTCPTCLKPLSADERAAMVNKQTAELAELGKLVDVANHELEKSVSAAAEHAKAVQAAQSTRERLNARLEAARASLEDVKDASEPESVDESRKVLDAFKTFKAGLSAHRDAVDRAKAELERVTNDLSRVSGKQEELEKAAANVPAEADVEAAEEYVKTAEAEREQLAQKQGQLKELCNTLTKAEAHLKFLNEHTERANRLAAYTNVLESARCLLHRDKFPSSKIRAFINRMLVRTNQYLDVMQAKFSISFDDDGFVAEFPEGAKLPDRTVTQPASRLSGGERIIFSLAFRFAVNTLHTDTGFLILDEPTAWLDDRHIDSVVVALERMKAQVANTVQVILSTHDERLIAVADGVTRIGG